MSTQPPIKQAMQEFIDSPYLPASGWTVEQFTAAQECTQHWFKYPIDSQLAAARAEADRLREYYEANELFEAIYNEACPGLNTPFPPKKLEDHQGRLRIAINRFQAVRQVLAKGDVS